MKVTADYIVKGTKRRPGIALKGNVRGIVLHDTGNPRSTAANNVNYYKNSAHEMYASAHEFVDDKGVIQCIPLSEVAYHVRYDCGTFNDYFIGIEYCFGGDIDSRKSYENYVERVVDLLFQFNLKPSKQTLPGHEELDPRRKTDPTNGLKTIGKDLQSCREDIKEAYEERLSGVKKPEKPVEKPKPSPKPKKAVKATVKRVESKVDDLNFYDKASWDKAHVAGTLDKGYHFTMIEKVEVEGYPMYKVKNSKGDVYYVTASTKYVKVVSV